MAFLARIMAARGTARRYALALREQSGWFSLTWMTYWPPA